MKQITVNKQPKNAGKLWLVFQGDTPDNILFQGNFTDCAEFVKNNNFYYYYKRGILKIEKQQNTQTNAEPVEGFTGGDWGKTGCMKHSDEMFWKCFVMQRDNTVGEIYGNSRDECAANAAIIAESKNMYYALKELMRFENLFNHVAPELQYPDNFLKAVNEAKAILNRINNHK